MPGRRQVVSRVRYIRDVEEVTALPGEARKALGPVSDRFKFRANDYYLSLIDWDDPKDPIRKIVIPETGELENFGALDASDEESNYTVAGCQHKYPDTALLVCNEVCGAYCRFCFRKRLFMDDNDEVVNDVRPGLEYIRRHPEITNVLLTGGDPLLMATRRLEPILKALRAIPHVRIIRIGSKMPAFNPYRITEDPELLEVLSRYSAADKRIYVMAHFNVPKELTQVACEGLDCLRRAGVITANQTPILRGINADPDVLATLSQRLSWIGVLPYYFFQCRPTQGNGAFEVPLVQTYEIFAEAKSRISGLAKTARLVMSHTLGKIEMVGLTDHHIYMRFHRARRAEDEGRFMIFQRDDDAYWLEDLVPVDDDSAPHPVQDLDRRVRPAWESD
jgi:lysine 2,3-aminomutase